MQKFKVITLERYCSFSNRFGANKDPQEYYNFCLIYGKRGTPLDYIEECENPGFPPRENIKYCVRVKVERDFYSQYQCYCYQLGKWWKYKKIQTIGTELYVPQLLGEHSARNINCPPHLLIKVAKADYLYWHKSSCDRNFYRSMRLSALSIKRPL